MRTSTGPLVALLAIAAVCEEGQADAQAPAPTLKQGEQGILTTSTMPDGIRVEVVQAEYLRLDSNDQLVRVSGDFHYIFTFQSGRRISATVSQYGTGEPAYITCAIPPAGGMPFSQCARWPETRQALMTLYALGSSAVVSSEGRDRVTIDRAAMGITNADVATWVAKATALNY